VADLRTTLCGIELKNPVIAASGTFGYGGEFASQAALDRIGAIVVKGLSREPIRGNASPRVTETAAGMLNAIGLQNVGVKAFVAEKLPLLAEFGVPVFANVFGHDVADYVEVLSVLEDAEGLAAYELNVSCPNTKRGGLEFGAHAGELSRAVEAARAVAKRRPLLVKLSPNVTDIGEMARAAVEGLMRLGHHITEDDGCIFVIGQFPISIWIRHSQKVAGLRLPDAIGGVMVVDAEIEVGAGKYNAIFHGAFEFALRRRFGAGPSVVIVVGHPEVFDLVIVQAPQQFLLIHF